MILFTTGLFSISKLTDENFQLKSEVETYAGKLNELSKENDRVIRSFKSDCFV